MTDKKYRNKTGEVLMDYVRTNQHITDENKKRQEEEGSDGRSLKNLNSREKTYVAVIAVCLIGIIIRYVIL